MNTLRVACHLLAAMAALTMRISAAPVLINFDDRPGLPEPPPFFPGTPLPLQFFVHDQYLPLGVSFNSAGGGIAILAAENAVSFPNSVAATELGPVISYSVPITATFFLSGLPAVVDFVSLDLSDSSSPSRLVAFDQNGVMLGSTMGGASATLEVTFPGQIHSVQLQQGPFGFDNFAFNGLVAVPEPAGLAWMIGVVGLAGGAGRRLLRGRRTTTAGTPQNGART